MKTKVLVRGAELELTDKYKIGDGGEAIVFDVTQLLGANAPTALKLWRKPTDAVYSNISSPTIERNNRAGAKTRLSTYPDKLRHFPKGLPSEVVAPQEFVKDASGKIVGFIMPLIDNAARLSLFSKRDYKAVHGIDAQETMKVFMNLWETVRSLHRVGIVVGDFNNKNVLVANGKAYIVDADSLQYGSFTAPGFTPAYVDPLHCDPKKRYPDQNKPHSKESDWYAFAVMLFEGLMETHPFFGGVYRPPAGSKQVPLDARPLEGISVFSPGVIYSTRAVPLSWLPPRAEEYFKRIFDTKGNPLREEFSREILEMLAQHAGISFQVEVRNVALGASFASIVFPHERLLQVAFQKGTLRFLEKGADGFMRDGNARILSGMPERGFRYRLVGDKTLIASGHKCYVIEKNGNIETQLSVDMFRGQKPIIDSNSERYFWVQGGKLFGSREIAPQYIGDVLEGQTLLWTGEKCGIGLYQLGDTWTPFIFSTEHPGINDSIQGISLVGELNDAQVYFSPEHVWLLVSLETNKTTTNHAFLLDFKGRLVAAASAPEGDGSWLGDIRGKAGATRLSKPGVPILYGLDDAGIHRIEAINGSLQETTRSQMTFNPASPPTRLFFDPRGELLLVGTRDVTSFKL